MKLSALLAPLIAAKASHDLILQTIVAFESQQDDALERRRENDRQRQARKRGMSRDITLPPRDRSLMRAGGARVEDKTLTLEIEPQKKEKEERKETRERAFDAFWIAYPNRVGKADAQRAFSKALIRTNPETLMAGLGRYIAKTDDRPWCNPATWLNQDRWTDEPAPPVARAGPRINPTLIAAHNLMEKLDAIPPSEIEGNHPTPSLLAFGGGRG